MKIITLMMIDIIRIIYIKLIVFNFYQGTNPFRKLSHLTVMIKESCCNDILSVVY